MKLPGKVKVGHLTYRIVWWPSVDASGDKWGECDHEAFTISIRPTTHGPIVADTLLHEILHAIYNAWTLKSKDDEERTVTTLASGLTAVMQDNPKLMQWLTDCARS